VVDAFLHWFWRGLCAQSAPRAVWPVQFTHLGVHGMILERYRYHDTPWRQRHTPHC
ncbi:hypothetical protein NDU88_002921, partial [Pleurodeles waltl]